MLTWELLETSAGQRVFRARVPGGWLVYVHRADGVGLTFYSDPTHVWDGTSNC